MNQRVIELAKKLKALADKGHGGEKLNAQKMLEKLLVKHNLTLEDIELDTLDYAYFKVNLIQAQIFWQVVSSVLGTEFKSYKDACKKGYIVFQITASQSIELHAKYDFYWRLYKQELAIFRQAFIAKNNIYHPDGGKKEISELTDKERAEIKRVALMTESIRSESFRKQIE